MTHPIVATGHARITALARLAGPAFVATLALTVALAVATAPGPGPELGADNPAADSRPLATRLIRTPLRLATAAH